MAYLHNASDGKKSSASTSDLKPKLSLMSASHRGYKDYPLNYEQVS